MTLLVQNPIDEARVEAFTGQLITDFAGAASTLMTVLGDRLGLFRALTGAGPVTAAGLAATTGLNPRLVTEWPPAQTVSGYVEHDAAAGTYELPAEHALALSVVDSPAYVVGVADILAGEYQTLDRLEHAFRGDGGVEYGDYPSSVHHGIERFFRTAYVNELAKSWFPAVPGLLDKLEAGARVADVGCGHGVATRLVAQLWPASTVTGFDRHAASVTVARAAAMEAGADVVFHVADSAEFGPGPFDVVVFFDALHDLGDPRAALRRAYEVLAPGGIVVAVEPHSTDDLTAGIGNPVARLNWAASTALCTPGSLSQPGAYGLGNQGGPGKRLDLLTDAGFADAVLAADTGFNLVVAAVKK